MAYVRKPYRVHAHQVWNDTIIKLRNGGDVFVPKKHWFVSDRGEIKVLCNRDYWKQYNFVPFQPKFA